MRCDGCDCDVPMGKMVIDTRSDWIDQPVGYFRRSRTISIRLCPECARRRAHWGWIAGLVLAVMVIGGIIALISEFVRR